jgi:hypothetical protein
LGLATSRSAVRQLAWLGATAGASLGLYALLAWRYPLAPSLADPRAIWSHLVPPTWPSAALHLAIYLGLTLLYLAALSILLAPPAAGPVPGEVSTPVRRWQFLLVGIVWLVCSALLMSVAPGGESHDIFDYLFRGRMMVELHANPLSEIPKSYRAAPYVAYVAWHSNVDTYGPLWEIASAGVAGAVHQVARLLGWWDEQLRTCPASPSACRLLIVYLSGYRLLAIGLTGLSGWLIASLVARRQPSQAPAALAAWLWSPLTLIASAVGAHNDALMLALLLVGLWLLVRRRPFLALMALILAAHVKLTALIWLPVVALWIVREYGWRRALRTGAASAACGLLVSWLLYTPFGGWQTLPRMLHERSLYLTNSVWRIAYYLILVHWAWPAAKIRQLTVALPEWLFAASAGLASLWMLNFRPRPWRSPLAPPNERHRQLWAALMGVSLLYLLVGSFWFQHWYLLWVLVPAVLLPDHPLTRSLLPWLVYGALSANLVMDFLAASALKPAPLHAYVLAVVIIWGPALVAWLFIAARHRMDRL